MRRRAILQNYPTRTHTSIDQITGVKDDLRDSRRALLLLLLYIGHFVRKMRAILGKSTANSGPYTFNGHIDMNATFPVCPLLLLLSKHLWPYDLLLGLGGCLCAVSYYWRIWQPCNRRVPYNMYV